MVGPKFKHDCEHCKFLGHYEGHDVYVCKWNNAPGSNGFSTSLIARYGNERCGYASIPLEMFRSLLTNNSTICGSGMPDMKYQDYVFSSYVIPSTKAMVLALAVEGGV